MSNGACWVQRRTDKPQRQGSRERRQGGSIMNDTFNPGGNMNLSGTRGLGLEMDPWAYEARGRNSGLRQGRREGYEEGRSEGHSDGFDDGFWDGLRVGRNQAWNEANIIIEQLNAEFSNERDEANRLGVSLRALRRTVETLIDKNPNSASYIRRLFLRNYEDEVVSAQSNGSIDLPPHVDPEFARHAPLMNAFINGACRK